jgi:hypothetical protein
MITPRMVRIEGVKTPPKVPKPDLFSGFTVCAELELFPRLFAIFQRKEIKAKVWRGIQN